MIRRTRAPLVLVLALFLAASSGVATPAAAAAPRVSRAIWAPSGFFGGNSESFTVSRPHGFLAAGIAFPSSRDTWILGGWTISGGAEAPVGSSWSLVPRLHASGASSEGSGTVNWLRLTLDGRLSQRRGGTISYQEAGLGMGVIDAPTTSFAPGRAPRNAQRTSGTPCFQLVGGLRADPDMAPAFQVETILAIGLGLERPSSLEVLVGLAF